MSNEVMNGQVIPPPEDLVAIEVIPIGAEEKKCEGAVVRLIRHEGQPEEMSLASGLSPDQCREIARRLLIIADAAYQGTQRTLLCVTETAMWSHPGQALIVHCDPDVRYNFAIEPQKTGQPERPRNVKLRRRIVPG
jgi:hypothetical protein